MRKKLVLAIACIIVTLLAPPDIICQIKVDDPPIVNSAIAWPHDHWFTRRKDNSGRSHDKRGKNTEVRSIKKSKRRAEAEIDK